MAEEQICIHNLIESEEREIQCDRAHHFASSIVKVKEIKRMAKVWSQAPNDQKRVEKGWNAKVWKARSKQQVTGPTNDRIMMQSVRRRQLMKADDRIVELDG